MATDWQVLEAATNAKLHYEYFYDLYSERRRRGPITLLREVVWKYADRKNVLVWIHGEDTKMRCTATIADEIRAAFERAEKELGWA